MIPSNGSVRPSRKSRKTSAPADDPQLAEREAGHRRDDHGDRDRTEHDQDARLEDRAHVGDAERVDEVAPVRVGGPVEPARVGAGLVQGRREQARERQQRPGDQEEKQRRPAQLRVAGDGHERSPLLTNHWIGSTQTRTRIIRTTASAEASPTSRL